MKQRRVQHRHERDAAKGRELAAARREIKQLKRLVARLQKTIKSLLERGEAVDEDPTPVETGPAPTAPTCGDCGSTDLRQFDTPSGKTLTICGGCKAWQ